MVNNFKNDDEITRDELTMALCAIRYTIGRQSYIVNDGVAWARKYGAASPRVRDIIICDLEEAVERVKNGFAGALGGAMDAKAWREVLAELKALVPPGGDPGDTATPPPIEN